MIKFDSAVFNPDVWAECEAKGLGEKYGIPCLPVNLLTTITYEPHIDVDTVIFDGHMASEHPFVWPLFDFAPFYMRLRVYLTHWLKHIEADIVEVRIESDQFDEFVRAGPSVEKWVNQGRSFSMN